MKARKDRPFCAPGTHRLRFIALWPDGTPDLSCGRWCENCPYRDNNGVPASLVRPDEIAMRYYERTIRGYAWVDRA